MTSTLNKASLEAATRDLSGSLQQCKEELRDAYMSFRDLKDRCAVDLGKQGADDSNPVYYFKPETFLLDEPEKQKQYRAELLKQVGSIPKADPQTYLGDELHRAMSQIVADRSTPKKTKEFLFEFFKRRQYALQHMKYKLLCRWAHLVITSEQAENVGIEATYIYGKLEYNLEQAIQRQERLEKDDFYDKATPENRPSTKTADGGSSLYVEKTDMAPQSIIREDDIQVYMRAVSHKSKLLKTVNKFLSRVKWLPLAKRYDIYENAVTSYFNQKKRNVDRQLDMCQKIESKISSSQVMIPELRQELDALLDTYYCRRYEKMFMTNTEKILHQWKDNHDQVPCLIGDNALLKITIVEIAKQFGLYGDIELDQGFSFSYQVTTFFPAYFQRQLIKSKFSIYDFQDGEDPNIVKQRQLTQAARIDTNIFRDLSTTKQAIPTDQTVQSELKGHNVKVFRLKASDNWLPYVVMSPTQEEWQQKQRALLNVDPDSLMVRGFDFLDVADVATVNRINEENTQLHLKNIKQLAQCNNPHDQISKVAFQTSDGEKFVNIDKMSKTCLTQQATVIETHLLKAVSRSSSNDEEESPAEQKLTKTGLGLRQLSSHLITAYYTLRYASAKDAKIRLMYSLNYYRSVQKRLALDLREFATRDRMNGFHDNPTVQADEASTYVVNQASHMTRAIDKIAHSASISDKIPNTRQNPQSLNEMTDMASQMKYKLDGHFERNHLSTCPSMPKHHAAHGEPLVRQASETLGSKSADKLSLQAVKLLGRIEYIELNEDLKEVYVKDDFGIYIMHDCVYADLDSLQQELIRVGSFYIQKSEQLLDPTVSKRSLPQCDRIEIIKDLLRYEADYQFGKVKLCQVYMECYEHVTDPLEQQRLMQSVTDIMARRPRLNLSANYFSDAYESEIECLEKEFELVRTLVDMQVHLEKTENKRLQDSLGLSYFLANQYEAKKWKYKDADTLICLLAKKKKDEGGTQATQSVHFSEHSEGPEPKPSTNKVWGESSSSDSEDERSGLFQEDEGDKYRRMLGLQKISLEQIYHSYQEKDVDIIKLMGEHSHFIELHEGYPEFLTRLTHGSIMDKNREFKPNPWSQETGALDFYESLDFINRVHAMTHQVRQELYESLTPWNDSLMTHIDIQVYEEQLQELHQVISIQDGTTVEYQGRDLIEDEQVLGSADKMIFYAKELIADLSRKPKLLLNPFIMAKLSLNTVKYFEFPDLQRDLNKYVNQRKGITGYSFVKKYERAAIVGVAKHKVWGDTDFNKQISDFIQGNVNLTTRNIDIPSLLEVYCNMAELHRLRSELILTMSECTVLQECYVAQSKYVGLKEAKLLAEGISFERGDEDPKLINFFDHGPAHMDTIDLACKEFDPVLMSNLNFRNPDSFKINVLTAGLEEVRAVLQYQVLQKHLLIVATRINCLTIDSHAKGLVELDLLQNKKLAVPNSFCRYQNLVNRQNDTLNLQAVKQERSILRSALNTFCHPIFYNIMPKKSAPRGQLAKDYSSYQTNVVQALGDYPYLVQRILRAYKVKLLNKFVQAALTEVYLDAQKVQAMHSCQRLRVFNRLFEFDPISLGLAASDKQEVLKYDTSAFWENFTANYLPTDFTQHEKAASEKKKPEIYKSLRFFDILDFTVIPSSTTILQVESSSMEDIRAFKLKRAEARNEVIGRPVTEDINEFSASDHTDPEIHLKQLLPTFTPQLLQAQKRTQEESDAITKKLGQSAGDQLDYAEALYFGDSKFAVLSRYYLALERVFQLEWFTCKLQFSPAEQIYIESAINTGCAFWNEDEFDARISKAVAFSPNRKGSRAYFQLYDKALSLRRKRNMAEIVQNFALTMQSFIRQYEKTKPELRFKYLDSYVDFAYQQIVGSLHKLVEQFSIQDDFSAVMTVKQAIADLTKMGHYKVTFLRPNNYSISTHLVSADSQRLDSSNLIFGSIQDTETQNFKRCIQPVINEKAMEPPQLSLFQALYHQDSLKRSHPSQFPGQLSSIANYEPFKALQYVLLQLNPEARQFAQSFIRQAKAQANDFMETVHNDQTLAESAYTLDQLTDAKKFFTEQIAALLLKNALMCWFQNSPLPTDKQSHDKFEASFRQNFFWKQLSKKEELTRKLAGQYGQVPTAQQLEDLKTRIDTLTADQSLATKDQILKRDQLVKALREEFHALKKRVTLDNYFGMKAEILVFSNEIEKFLIQASVKVLDQETRALSKCFSMSCQKIQFHIHPFQQFAATLFDRCDPFHHLDITNRVTAAQKLLTKMRNRSTEIDVLTAGPGMVISIKDMNDLMSEFCRDILKDHQLQFKSRIEMSHLMEEDYRAKLYRKDRQIETLKARLLSISQNLEHIIDARIFEKGNQLVYELDHATRLLRLYKSSMSTMEHRLFSQIMAEMTEKVKRQENEVDVKNQKFSQYKSAIHAMINAEWEADAEKLKITLKQRADQAKITDETLQKSIDMYPGQSHGQLPGSVLPQGFEHYPSCSCYQPDPRFPKPTMELAKLEMLSERDARMQLAHMQDLLRKQRILFRTQKMALETKHQSEMALLKKQLNCNTSLWEQVSEAEKRETVLRKELLYTQQQLSVAEKTIANGRDEIKQIDAERVRLLNFKTQNFDHMKELQEKVTQINLFEKVDTEKLLMALAKKDDQVTALKSAHILTQNALNTSESRRNQDIAKLRATLRDEQLKSQALVEKMEQMKVELKLMETNSDQSVTNVWRQKCKELYDVCSAMRKENEELRLKCRELITQGLELAETMKTTQKPRVGSSMQQLPSVQTGDSQLKATKYTASTNTHQAVQQSTGKKFDEVVISPDQLQQWGFNQSIDSCYSKKQPLSQQQPVRAIKQTDQSAKRFQGGIKQIISEPANVNYHYQSQERRTRYPGGSVDATHQQQKIIQTRIGTTHHQKRGGGGLNSDSQLVNSTLSNNNNYGLPMPATRPAVDLSASLRRTGQAAIQFDVKGTNIPQLNAAASPKSRFQRQDFTGKFKEEQVVTKQETLTLSHTHTASVEPPHISTGRASMAFK